MQGSGPRRSRRTGIHFNWNSIVKENAEMELKEILGKCDHTLLAQGATWKEIQAICDDGMKYHCASVCIPASYVKQAAD